jgi:hypothetical protein
VETAQVEYSVVVPLFFGGFFGHEEMVVPATRRAASRRHREAWRRFREGPPAPRRFGR